MVYQIASYRYWQQHLGRDDFEYGQFGENLTVDGLPDDEVCIGDRYRIGDAEFEVTQPRVTCYRVGLRLGVPEMPALLVGHHRPGFYMRVLREGDVAAGDRITKTRERPRGPHRRRRRRAPLPAGPRRRRPPAGHADPRAQPGVAGLVPRAPRGRGHRPGARRAGLARLPRPAGERGRPRDRDRHVDLAVRSRRDPAAGRPGRPVPHGADPGQRPVGPGPQLLALLRPRARPPTGSASSTRPADWSAAT